MISDEDTWHIPAPYLAEMDASIPAKFIFSH